MLYNGYSYYLLYMKSYKILVSSVDPWSEKVGSDTLTSLLSQFDSSQIASLNIRAKQSDSHVAARYFHIIEDRVIKSIIYADISTGEEYTVSEQVTIPEVLDYEKERNRYSKNYRISRWILVIIRELLWKCGRWKSKELDAFVESFNPDVLFFPIESYIHFNRINNYIIKKYQPKRVIGYMWDDNFTFKQHPFNLLYYLHRAWLRKSVKELIRNCSVVFAITPKLKRELDSAYGIDSILLTKPLRKTEIHELSSIGNPIKLLYTGKLNIGRDKTLAAIVDAIRVVNHEKQKVILDVYTNSSFSEKIKSRIDVPGCCNIHDFIPQSQVLEKQKHADVLLFIEALSKNDLSARLSFSTKITDYFSAGKCIWAVGNSNLAPIDYLQEEGAAFVSNSKQEILTKLQEIVNSPEKVVYCAQKAYECGKRNHDSELINMRFRNAICESYR